MRILITNSGLHHSSGTETFTFELATRMRTAGHLPVVYSQITGGMAARLAQAGIPVVSDLRRLQAAPDIIHGHHHLETMTACLAFPQVPAVFVCHGWWPWEELPPTFPTIMTYVGVGPVTLERILTHVRLEGRPSNIVPTHFDDERFLPRETISEVPIKALIFSNRLTAESPVGKAIIEACKMRKVDVAGLGYYFGRMVDDPSETLRTFDLVFASGRSAVEAMASGCGVIVADAHGVAGFATADRLDGPAGVLNLSSRSSARANPSSIARQIDRYTPDLVQAATAHVWRTRPLSLAVERYLDIYTEAIARFRTGPRVSPERLLAEASAYIQTLAPILKGQISAQATPGPE